MVGLTTTPSLPALTGAQITELASKVSGTKYPRASTKQAAVNRLVKALNDRVGKKSDGVFKKLGNILKFEEAVTIIERYAMTDATVNAAPAKTRTPRTPKAVKESNNGLRSSLSGKTLYPNCEENPRRKGTHGHKSMQIIMDNPDGISSEEFVSQGGRLKDLHWDIARDVVRVK